MHRPLSLLALACLVAACSRSPAPGDDDPSVQPAIKPSDAKPANRAESESARAQTRLTIYSGDYEALANVEGAVAGMPGYALVERPLHYGLKAGSNAISATSVPPSMDIEAAMLRPQTPGVTVLGQRYIAPLSGAQDVMAKAIGQRVAVEHTSGDAKQTDSGTLLSASDGLTLALTDGRIKVIHDYDTLSIIDSADLLPQQALLQWTVSADKAGDARFLLGYPMGGMAWRAEYLATLAQADNCQLALEGAALVANRSGVTFDDARLTLIAGEPNRERKTPPYARMEYAAADSVAANAPSMPAQRTSGEYRAYELPGTVRITNGATERVPLFPRRPAIACERAYVVDADIQDWQPPQPIIEPDFRGRTGTLPVNVAVSFQNTEAAGLGQPLPAGRVRVFDGNDLLGESQLDHTAEGSEVRLEVGTAFDLSAERENTAFNVDRAGRAITESFAITLGNAKSTAVTVRVVEPLPRWSDWEIVDSSVPSERKDARHAEFEVPVPAGGETRLTYTVRYRWAQGVTP